MRVARTGSRRSGEGRGIAELTARSSRRNSHLGFDGIFMPLNIFAFLLNGAAERGLPGRSLNEPKQALLPISHESVETIGPEERRINQ